MTYEQAQKDMRTWRKAIVIGAAFLVLVIGLLVAAIVMDSAALAALSFPLLLTEFLWQKLVLKPLGDAAQASVREFVAEDSSIT